MNTQPADHDHNPNEPAYTFRDKSSYRSLSVEEIMAMDVDDEKRRDYLETLIYEHLDDSIEAQVVAELEALFDDREELAELQESYDLPLFVPGAEQSEAYDSYRTDLIDCSTDDALATVLRKLMAPEKG